VRRAPKYGVFLTVGALLGVLVALILSFGVGEETTSPLTELLMAAASGTLEDVAAPAFAEAVAITVVVASEGYPAAPVTGRPIGGLDAAASVDGVHLAHAATAQDGGGLIATGGRVVDVVALGTTFAEARKRAYEAVDLIALEGSQHRTDIAAGVIER
jgi:phosphoribosylamine--glycine ligase